MALDGCDQYDNFTATSPHRHQAVRTTPVDDEDDYKSECEYPDCRLNCGLSVETPKLLPGQGTIRSPKHVQFLIGSEPVQNECNDFADMVAFPSEFESTFEILEYTVEVVRVTSQADVNRALLRPARLRVVVIHGDKCGGLKCPDGDVAWGDIPLKLGPTGLLVLLSCHSNDVMVWDPDDEYGDDCSLPDALFPLVEGYHFGVNALITVTGRSHHFTFRFRDNTHFEIQRMATLLELCDHHDFRKAVNNWNAEIEQNLDPVVAKSIRGHERIQAYDGKISGTPSE